MNSVILTGRATKDFELRYSPQGVAIANCTIAVQRNKDEADFISLVAFKNTAERAANSIKKGHRFGVQGRIQTRSYDKDGQKVYVTEVLVDRIEFLESKVEEQNATPPPKKEPQYTPDTSDLPF